MSVDETRCWCGHDLDDHVTSRIDVEPDECLADDCDCDNFEVLR